MAKTLHSQCREGVPGSIPGQGTRPYMPQLKILYMLQLRLNTAKLINVKKKKKSRWQERREGTYNTMADRINK